MKRILFITLLAFAFNLLFAHIDRPMDALIFEGKTYETYSQPLSSFVGSSRTLKRTLAANPANPRLPKHYYATYEIRDSKLYLNKVEIIYLSDSTMRKWRFPLALNYELRFLEASKLFGEGVEYPILCDWYTGTLFSTIFDGNRYYLHLFDENYYFKIKEGNFIDYKKFSTRNILASTVSVGEERLIYKFFTDESFGYKNKLIDLRCVADLSRITENEFFAINNGQPFKTRGFYSLDKRKNPCIYVGRTRNSNIIKLAMIDESKQNLSDFKVGDRVEAVISLSPKDRKKVALLHLKHLDDDELIHSPDFFLRLDGYGIPQAQENKGN